VGNLRQAVHVRLWNRPRLWRFVATAAHPSNRGRRTAAIARALRYQVNTEMRGRPTMLPIGEHSKVIGYPGEIDPIFSVVRNPPDWPEMLVWRRYLRPGDLFVDVGANIGLYTIYALEQGAEVIAVEPNKASADRIREHLELNGYTADVVEKAAADQGGTVYITSDLDVLNHLVDDPSQGVPVEATTIDELVGDRVAMVKIDVEGAEELALRGARRALKEQRIPVLQLEWLIAPHMSSDDRGPVLEMLREADYELCICDRYGGLHPLGDRQPPKMNVFAVPRGSAGP
jgi:FkbM family methyltransferase